MAYLPTLSTTSWESDPLRIIDERLASYMISYSLDTDYMRSGLMSLEYDIAMNNSTDSKLISAIERSIYTLLSPYIGEIKIEVKIKKTNSADIHNIVISIKGLDSSGKIVDGNKIFYISDSKVVKMSDLS